jgi:hypothetical protein
VGLRGDRGHRRGTAVPFRGLDSESGTEFINAQLFAWCGENQITFTRSRRYRKNDNCFVEQKHWPVVRQQVEYLRYNTLANSRSCASSTSISDCT